MLMFDAIIDEPERNRVRRYRLNCSQRPLTFADVLDLWQRNEEFRSFYTRLLTDSPFAAFRWETPALSNSTIDRPFQFVLLDYPRVVSRPADAKAFEPYFTFDDTDEGIVSFGNLSGDATLVVPSPRSNPNVYGHLAAFIRGAPPAQVDALWRVVGTCLASRIGNTSLWLSTAGGGVAWLHVRLDSHPKYYGYSPYKKPE